MSNVPPVPPPNWASELGSLLRQVLQSGSMALGAVFLLGVLVIVALIYGNLTDGMKWVVIGVLGLLLIAVGALLFLGLLRQPAPPSLSPPDVQVVHQHILLETGRNAKGNRRHISVPLEMTQKALLAFYQRILTRS